MNRDFVEQIVITGRAKSVGPENSISDPIRRSIRLHIFMVDCNSMSCQ